MLKKMIGIIFLFLAVFFISCMDKEDTRIANFTTRVNKYTWPVTEFNLPVNWSDFEYIELELLLSSPERVSLELHTGHGPSAITLLPAANAWIRMAIPLRFYRRQNTEGSEMAALFSRSTVTGWFNIWGVNCGPLDKVDSLSFIINSPTEQTRLEIKSIRLTNQPHEEFIAPKTLVDKFGQWAPDEWDGKVKNMQGLQAAWQKDDSLLSTRDDLGRDKFGGFSNTTQKATGYFYTKKINNRWWFVDPQGHLFLAAGMNGVSPGNYTRTAGRTDMFAELPPAEFQRPTDNNAPLVSFSLWNQQRKFGDDWQNEWEDLAVKRLRAWGFTAINWSSSSLNDRVVYAKFLYGWGIEEGVMGLPDIYSQAFLDRVDRVAKEQCLPLKDDPWLLGYFIGNEPVWPGMESVVVDAILQGDDTKMKGVLTEYLKKGDTPERRKEFIHTSYIKFLDIINNAIKRYDPNHLILGMRFGGDLNIEDDIIQMAEIFDVFSFNAYVPQIPNEKLDRVAHILDMPILNGEFHFGVAGRGMAGGLQQVENQQERGKAYRHYVENAMAHPAVVGTFWFLWRDQSTTGRNDGENYNIGLVDVTDLVYHELVDAMITTHKRLFDVHKGTVDPYNKNAR